MSLYAATRGKQWNNLIIREEWEHMNLIQWELIPTPTQAEMQEAVRLTIFPWRSQSGLVHIMFCKKATQKVHQGKSH